MQEVNIKKGCRFRMVGAPSSELKSLPDPARVAFLPARIPYIKPRLKVARGDRVLIGSPLFEDKYLPEIQFLSPAGGVVSDIRLGPRRVVQAIVIDRQAGNEPQCNFTKLPLHILEAMRVVQAIVIDRQAGTSRNAISPNCRFTSWRPCRAAAW